MTIHAVIIDLGGVLLRTEDRTPRALLSKRLGMTYAELSRLVFDSETAQLATVGKIPVQAHWDYIRGALQLSPEEFQQVPSLFWGGDRLDTDLVDYIRSLRPRYKTAMLSNAWGDLRQVIEQRWKITDAFDELIISAEVGLAKPDPRIYRLALDRLKATPPEAVFVDDFLENVEAARGVGLHAIHYENPAQTRAELEQLLKKDD